MADQSFPKRVRLLRASEFERVFAGRTSATDPWMALYGVANELGHPRLGITVSRRVGMSVVRSRWKRLLREAFRQSQHRLPALDLVCVVRAHVPPPLSQLLNSIPGLAARIESKLKRAGGRAESAEM